MVYIDYLFEAMLWHNIKMITVQGTFKMMEE